MASESPYNLPPDDASAHPRPERDHPAEALLSLDPEGPDGRWLACARRMGAAARAAVTPLVGTNAGRVIRGRGGGGDLTVELDEAAERAMLETADRCAPHPFRLVSEELGEAGDPSASWWVVVDPVDGSLNAKRGIPIFSAVVAIADGGTLDDVRVGYTMNLVSGVEYGAARGYGLGASTRVETVEEGPEVEVVLLEAGRPDKRAFVFGDLSGLASSPPEAQGMRVRQLGSLALGLCQVAVGSADILLSPIPSRAIDVAAGLRMVRESGGDAASLEGGNLWEQPLDLARRNPIVAWRAGVDGERILRAARAALGFR